MTASSLPRLRQLIAQLCDIGIAEVRPESRLRGFAVDSLRAVDLVVALEERFGIELDIRELEPVKTIADLAELIDARGDRQVMEGRGHGARS